MVALLQLCLIGLALLLEVSAAAFLGQNALILFLLGVAAISGLYQTCRGEHHSSLYLATGLSAGALALHLALWSSSP
ncbi:MAG: hypothetical protein JRH20_14195 [Deltaproteobacteria bacterium]|nr:hypothetical protein [Deltaproteobacteria bacterium]